MSNIYQELGNYGSTGTLLVRENVKGPGVPMLWVDRNPNGLDVGALHQRAVDRFTGAMYQNTNGGTAWGVLAFAPASNTLFGSPFGIMRSAEYYWALNGLTTTSVTLGNGTLRVAPMWVPNAVTLTRIGIGVTVAGDATAKVRLGVYGDDGAGRPGALLVDAGQVDASAVGDPEAVISLAVGSGWYWIGGAVQGVATTQPTVRAVSSNHSSMPLSIPSGLPAGGLLPVGYAVAGVTGALPSSFGAVGLSGASPRIFIKT